MTIRILAYSTLILAIFFIAGLANGAMDEVNFHFSDSPYVDCENADYYTPTKSWKYKYEEDEFGRLVPAPKEGLYSWYHKRFNLAYKERFFLSGTALVGFTDFWHKMKTTMMNTQRLAFCLLLFMFIRRDNALLKSLLICSVAFVFIWAVQALGFHIIY